jgi:hypothetical protein
MNVVKAIFDPVIVYEFDSSKKLTGVEVTVTVNMEIKIGDVLTLYFPNLVGPELLGPIAVTGFLIKLHSLYFSLF